MTQAVIMGVKDLRNWIAAMPVYRYCAFPNARVAAWQIPTGRHLVVQNFMSTVEEYSNFSNPRALMVWVKRPAVTIPILDTRIGCRKSTPSRISLLRTMRPGPMAMNNNTTASVYMGPPGAIRNDLSLRSSARETLWFSVDEDEDEFMERRMRTNCSRQSGFPTTDPARAASPTPRKALYLYLCAFHTHTIGTVETGLLCREGCCIFFFFEEMHFGDVEGSITQQECDT